MSDKVLWPFIVESTYLTSARLSVPIDVCHSDRPATSRGENNRRANKILADVALQPKGPDFWKPVRDSMLMSLPPSTQPKTDKLVVTYVSRQHAPKGRRLDPEDNDRLEAALRALEPEIEVNLVYFEEYNRVEQIHMAARTDVGPTSFLCSATLGGTHAHLFLSVVSARSSSDYMATASRIFSGSVRNRSSSR